MRTSSSIPCSVLAAVLSGGVGLATLLQAGTAEAEPTGAPGTVPVLDSPPPMPSAGLGVFAGGRRIKDLQDTTDVGLLARWRLTSGLLLEGEVGKDRFSGSFPLCRSGEIRCFALIKAERIDHWIGGSLIWEIAPHNSLAPYLLAGGGAQQVTVITPTTQEFGEIGVGLRLALSRNVHIIGDVRAGRSKTLDSSSSHPAIPMAIRPEAPGQTIDLTMGGVGNDTEDYRRVRLAAVITF